VSGNNEQFPLAIRPCSEHTTGKDTVQYGTIHSGLNDADVFHLAKRRRCRKVWKLNMELRGAAKKGDAT
jgi:hypothetical protein